MHSVNFEGDKQFKIILKYANASKNFLNLEKLLIHFEHTKFTFSTSTPKYLIYVT